MGRGRLVSDLVKEGAVTVHAFVVFTQQGKNSEQTVAPRLTVESAVTADDLQQLRHGHFEFIMGKHNGTQAIPRFEIVWVSVDGFHQRFRWRGVLGAADEIYMRGQMADLREFAGFSWQRFKKRIGLRVTPLQDQQFHQIKRQARIIRFGQRSFRRLSHGLVKVAALVGQDRRGVPGIGLARDVSSDEFP